MAQLGRCPARRGGELGCCKAERLWELRQLRRLRPVADPRGAVGARVAGCIGGALWERLRLEGLLWPLQSVCLLTDSSLPGLLSLSARGRSSSRVGGGVGGSSTEVLSRRGGGAAACDPLATQPAEVAETFRARRRWQHGEPTSTSCYMTPWRDADERAELSPPTGLAGSVGLSRTTGIKGHMCSSSGTGREDDGT